MLPISIKSVENIAKFRPLLKTHLYNLAYPPLLPGIAISQLDLFIDSEIDQPICIDAPLRLVSKDLGTIEII